MAAEEKDVVSLEPKTEEERARLKRYVEEEQARDEDDLRIIKGYRVLLGAKHKGVYEAIRALLDEAPISEPEAFSQWLDDLPVKVREQHDELCDDMGIAHKGELPTRERCPISSGLYAARWLGLRELAKKC